MAASEENGALFPIFILTIMALPLVPYTIMKLCRAASKKDKVIHCQCTECSRSRKYRKSIFKRISNFSTCSNLTMVLLWIVMIFLVYYIKNVGQEIQVFEPFSILGVEPGASDSEIKKAYRRLSVQYHPDPEAHKYFVEYIAKAYQALTDPISREDFEKYGHPDGRQGFQMGIALPQFLLARHRWGIWWHTFTLDCWRLYSLAFGDCRDIYLKVIKIYRKPCHASKAICLLLLHETFFVPKQSYGSLY